MSQAYSGLFVVYLLGALITLIKALSSLWRHCRSGGGAFQALRGCKCFQDAYNSLSSVSLGLVLLRLKVESFSKSTDTDLLGAVWRAKWPVCKIPRLTSSVLLLLLVDL